MNELNIDLINFFHPESIAIVGVPRGENRFGGMSFLTSLQGGRYAGRLYPINPKAEELAGLKSYPNISSLPEVPELTIICISAKYVENVLEECARVGARHIHIFSSGFKEIGTEEGRRLEERIKSISREHGLLVIGPNCMGPYCPPSGLTSWGAIPGQSGPLGIISQSGGITQRLTEYAFSLGVGTEMAVSFGNAAVLDVMDFLAYMAKDDTIKVIAMYLEGVADARQFMELAREINQKKPIIIWKGGETEVGARTVASHTGSMAGRQSLWQSFFKQTGVTQVFSLDEWVDMIMAFSLLPAPAGKGVFVIGGGGGYSVAHGDACVQAGLSVPLLSETTMESLKRSVPVAGSIAGNPLDMWRTFEDAAYLLEVLKLGYEDQNTDMIMVDRLIPTRAFHMQSAPDPTREIAEFIHGHRHKKPAVITVNSGGGDTEMASKGTAIRAEFTHAGIPAYPSLDRAARALFNLYRYYRYLERF
ncbi:MAG: CoA-binding protein [Deltaproteobacteria bacterium]|nr:CoA-binding protein [Deltaproteobacteria bacterium]